MSRRVLVLGDALLDRDVSGASTRLCPDAPVPVVEVQGVAERPGGAGLAAMLLAATGMAQVTLVTALAPDAAGSRLRRLLGESVEVRSPVRLAHTPCKTRVRVSGQSLLRLDDFGELLGGPSPGSEPPGSEPRGADPQAVDGADAGPAELDALFAGCDAVLVADYGGPAVREPAVREALARWASRRPIVWDPHPRGLPPVPGVTVATPNRAEAEQAFGSGGQRLEHIAAALRDRWRSHGVAVTDGASGAVLAMSDSTPLVIPAAPVPGLPDSCGAGDRFAGAVAAGLASGAVISEAVVGAVAAVGEWLAAGGVSANSGRGGGTTVATGGCFDVLHAGHISLLESARQLGDRLVVLLNSDASVRRLKGADRPRQTAADRARVLRSLSCVDAVEIFDEDDPRRALERLRPDIWVKGGDYAAHELPEAAVVTGYGGRVVCTPYLAGRSTSRIITSHLRTEDVRL